jgi:hypothetical protein
MLYPFTVAVVDLYQNWLCFKFFQNMWSKSMYFLVFLNNFVSTVVILDLPCSFSVPVLLPCSRVGVANVLYNHCLVFFWASENFRT